MLTCQDDDDPRKWKLQRYTTAYQAYKLFSSKFFQVIDECNKMDFSLQQETLVLRVAVAGVNCPCAGNPCFDELVTECELKF